MLTAVTDDLSKLGVTRTRKPSEGPPRSLMCLRAIAARSLPPTLMAVMDDLDSPGHPTRSRLSEGPTRPLVCIRAIAARSAPPSEGPPRPLVCVCAIANVDGNDGLTRAPKCIFRFEDFKHTECGVRRYGEEELIIRRLALFSPVLGTRLIFDQEFKRKNKMD
ncbi:hypothetical protein B0H17DRAFT_1135346 [Mycena rosella]|uniref:Uncharacterized protein n=1 Tax=Mycena rosella TaxID=1033263 RepID=A0AAD7DGL9_MYCRO|nr:hypothetical protein B0H17DRAFT_1135346 [Mycena rosella]